MEHRAPRPARTLRSVAFDLDDRTDPIWNRGAVEFVAAANGVSLMMPHVEPYFVRTVRAAVADLPPDLAATAEHFCRQELAHQAQHRRFNRLQIARYPRLARLDRCLARTYRRMGSRWSRADNLAVAAASETIAYSLARWASDHLAEFMRGADATVGDLFLWHLAEEVEHKSVAFDVYAAVDGSRLRLARASVVSLVLLAVFDLWALAVVLAAEGRLWRPATPFRLVRLAFSFAFEVLPNLFSACLPGHHPDQLSDPSWFGPWLSDLERRSA